MMAFGLSEMLPLSLGLGVADLPRVLPLFLLLLELFLVISGYNLVHESYLSVRRTQFELLGEPSTS